MWFASHFSVSVTRMLLSSRVSLLVINLLTIITANSNCTLITNNETRDDNYNRVTPQAAQAHYMNADVTLACACERCCVTNGCLQRLVWDVNGFS